MPEPARVQIQKLSDSGPPPVYEVATATILPRIGEAELLQADAWRTVLATTNEQDREWNWREILRDCTTDASRLFEHYSLLLDGVLQTLMVAELNSNRSRLDGQPLVYVEYFATAPFNRGRIMRPRQNRLCGEALLAYTRQRSIDIGYEGRVGLHSLVQSVAYYQTIGMRSFPLIPEDEGFAYFEFPPGLI